MKINLRKTLFWVLVLTAMSYLLSRFFDLSFWPVFAFFIIFACLNETMGKRGTFST
jgi:hypothetical protein